MAEPRSSIGHGSRWPFWMRRPGLLVQGLRANREQPDLEALRGIETAEGFVWAILPHAARSFAPCIVVLPGRQALPAALGYLYCRVLDTYEDLIEDESERFEALAGLPERLEALRGGGPVGRHPKRVYSCRDQRDEAHALLADEGHRLDVLFQEMAAPVQSILIDLVHDMSNGMRWAGRIFQEQGGVLMDGEQVRTYCEAVLGNPIRYAARLFSWGQGRPIDLEEEVGGAAMNVGEFLQLANITRDIEKDLARGVAYHPALSDAVREGGGEASAERVLEVRAVMTDRALGLAPEYLTLVDGLRLGAGWMSASALLMLRFTERYYSGCARKVGVEVSSRPGPGRLVRTCWPALLSGAWARRRMARVVEGMAALRQELPRPPESMYLN